MMTLSNGSIFRVTGPLCVEFKAQWSGILIFFSFDLGLNKWLSKQSRRWWFETPSRSLWRHCNDPGDATTRLFITTLAGRYQNVSFSTRCHKLVTTRWSYVSYNVESKYFQCFETSLMFSEWYGTSNNVVAMLHRKDVGDWFVIWPTSRATINCWIFYMTQSSAVLTRSNIVCKILQK